jgi:hypothetical protein
MNLNNKDKDTLIAIILLAFGICVTYLSLKIEIKKYAFIESAASFPLLLSIIFTLLSIVYLITSVKKGGKVTFQKIWHSLKSNAINQYNKRIIFALSIISLLIFVGVPYLGFYLSGLVFFIFILIVYVPKINPIFSILLGAVFIALLYLIFSLLFQLQIK